MNRLALVLAAMLLVQGCTAAPGEAIVTPPPGVEPTPVVAATPQAEPLVSLSPLPIVRPAASPSAIALPLSILAGRSGGDLRLSVGLILEEQALLTAATLQAAHEGRRDEVAGVVKALDQSSSTLAAIVGAVEGYPRQQALLETLRAQTVDLIAFAQGDSVTRASLDAWATDDLLRQRVQEAADVVNGKADAGSSAAAHVDDVARPLAATLAIEAGKQVAGPTEGLDIDLRLALDRRLQARVYLLGQVVDGQRDAQQALNSNAEDFGQQLAPYYGDQIATGISGALRDANTDVVGLADGQPREAVLNGLDLARADLDAQLSGANPLLPRGLLLAQLRSQDQELLAAVDSFGSHDWGGAYGHLHQASKLSQRFGDLLAEATINRYPGRFVPMPTPEPQDSGALATMT